MTKGLGITLAVIAIALAGISGAQAYVPVMDGIPDVTVGDSEDNLTMDINFFNYPNVYDLRDFVVDWDTPTTSIIWSHTIAGGFPFVAQINGKKGLEVAPVQNPVLPSADRRLTDPAKGIYGARYSIIRFFDQTNPAKSRVPGIGVPPYQPTGSRTLTVYASDGTRADSKTAMVYYVDNGADSVSYSVTAIDSATFNFASDGTAEFVTNGAPTGLALGTYSTNSGNSLSIQVGGSAASPNGGFFGRWNTPTIANRLGDGLYRQVIPYYANSLYRVRYAMRTTQANPILFPAYRVNSFNDIFTQAYERSLAPVTVAEALEGLFLSASARNVDLYIQLPDDAPGWSGLVNAGGDFRTMAVGWDLLDLNGQPGGGQQAIGTVFVDSIVADRFPRPEANPQGPFEVIARPADVLVNNAGFPAGASTWQRTNNLDGSVTMHVQGTATAPAGAKVGLLELPFGYGSLLWREANYVQDREVLIRANYRLSVPLAANRAQWVNFRLRWGAELGNLGGLVGLQRGNGIGTEHLAVVPPAAPSTHDYALVFSMPPVPAWTKDYAMNSLGHAASFILAFDGVNNTGVLNANLDGGTATLHRIEVEAMPVPQD